MKGKAPLARHTHIRSRPTGLNGPGISVA